MFCFKQTLLFGSWMVTNYAPFTFIPTKKKKKNTSTLLSYLFFFPISFSLSLPPFSLIIYFLHNIDTLLYTSFPLFDKYIITLSNGIYGCLFKVQNWNTVSCMFHFSFWWKTRKKKLNKGFFLFLFCFCLNFFLFICRTKCRNGGHNKHGCGHIK